MTPAITFVVPVNDDLIYEQCFKASPLFGSNGQFEIFCQRGFSSSAQAFNTAIEAAANELIVMCHQDIILPVTWADTFTARIKEINQQDPHWGVVGCAGITKTGQRAIHIYRHDRELQGDVPLPARIRTLDECIIAIRRSSGLQFDINLPGFFFYAVDICLQAEARGLSNYALDAPCFHQAKNRNSLARSFYRTEAFIIRKWEDRLPIQTLSGRVAGLGYLHYKRTRNSWDRLCATLGYHKKPWWFDLPKIQPQELLG